MTLGELSLAALRDQLGGNGLRFGMGPFVVRLRGGIPRLAEQLQLLYPAAPLHRPDTEHPADFLVTLRRPWGPRRWWHPQVALLADGDPPFAPFPLDHALPLFEWGLNWCIATQAQQYLMLHAAVLERDGRALIMPALPGSGKSTLCAALMHRGWRLLSDEFALLRPEDPDLALHPLPRPVPLKNESIEVIRAFEPEAVIGPTFPKTRKGDVAHVMAPLDSQRRSQETAQAGWIVFPRFQAGAPTTLEPLGGNWTFLKLSGNSFNYQLQGGRGFDCVKALVDRCPAHALHYSRLEEAVAAVDRLTRPTHHASGG